MEKKLENYWLPGHNIPKHRELEGQKPTPVDASKKAEILRELAQSSPSKSANRSPRTPNTPTTPNSSGSQKSQRSPRQSQSLNQGYFKTPPPPQPPQSPRPKAVQKLTFNTTQKGKK
jgi:hypothetical protein